MKSIVFILPYFGKWPFWMKYFLASCAANPSIDWLIYSDNDDLPLNTPNVKYKKTTLNDYIGHASRTLGVNIPNDRPYKLCDIKPMYGFIHENEITGYDYWGFCDLDLIWGDLRSFLTEGVLTHDLISAHRTRISGHCCLLKNTPKMREAFRKCKNWEKVCGSERNHRFDESDFSKLFMKNKRLPDKWRNIFSFLLPVNAKCIFVERHSTPNCRLPWTDGSSNYPNEWYWNSGKLTNDQSESDFMYFHFLFWKQTHWKSDYKKKDGHLHEGHGLSAVPDDKLLLSWQINYSGFSPSEPTMQ